MPKGETRLRMIRTDHRVVCDPRTSRLKVVSLREDVRNPTTITAERFWSLLKEKINS